MNQCKALNFQIIEEKPVNAELDFQGEIIQNSGGIKYETDPTVPAWAKEPEKPTYAADEVGAVPIARKIADIDLKDDITVEELQKALDTYPVLRVDEENPSLSVVRGEVGQLLITTSPLRSGATIYRCTGPSWEHDDNVFYGWEEVVSSNKVNYAPYGNPDEPPDARAPLGDMFYRDIKGNEALWMCVFIYGDTRKWVRIPLVSNIVTEISDDNTDVQIPSAKATKVYIDNLFANYDNNILAILGGDENVE